MTAVARGRISITEMKEALQLKYDLLRKKLFWDMLRRSVGKYRKACEINHCIPFTVKQYSQNGSSRLG